MTGPGDTTAQRPADTAQRPDATAQRPADTTAAKIAQLRLSTALLGDVLDLLGFRHQFLPPQVRPLDPALTVVGRAMPVLITRVFGPQPRPFGRLTEALDQLRPGEVYLARGGGAPCAAWGEILSVTARRRGAAGAVIDGYHRDTRQIRSLGWPVFSRGGYAQDAGVRASVIDFRVPAEFGRVRVEPGDLVVGDVDGVVAIPRACEAEVIERAARKAAVEHEVRSAIENGMPSTEAFARYGVL